MIHQYESLLVSDILDKPFTNVTLDYIDKSFPLLGGSLPDDCEQQPQGDSANGRKSQARVDIEMADLYFNAITELSSVIYTPNVFADHCEEEYYCVTISV